MSATRHARESRHDDGRTSARSSARPRRKRHCLAGANHVGTRDIVLAMTARARLRRPPRRSPANARRSTRAPALSRAARARGLREAPPRGGDPPRAAHRQRADADDAAVPTRDPPPPPPRPRLRGWRAPSASARSIPPRDARSLRALVPARARRREPVPGRGRRERRVQGPGLGQVRHDALPVRSHRRRVRERLAAVLRLGGVPRGGDRGRVRAGLHARRRVRRRRRPRRVVRQRALHRGALRASGAFSQGGRFRLLGV